MPNHETHPRETSLADYVRGPARCRPGNGTLPWLAQDGLAAVQAAMRGYGQRRGQTHTARRGVRCESRRTKLLSFAGLHKAYNAWAVAGGEREVSKKKLAIILEDRGFKRDRDEKCRGFKGLRLILVV